jgi:hypothetical protein
MADRDAGHRKVRFPPDSDPSIMFATDDNVDAMNLLITGANGFIGKALARRLLTAKSRRRASPGPPRVSPCWI